MPDGGGGEGNLCSVSSPSVTFGATSPWRGRISFYPSAFPIRIIGTGTSPGVSIHSIGTYPQARYNGSPASVAIISARANPASRAVASQTDNTSRPTPRRVKYGSVYIARMRAASCAGSSNAASRNAVL